MGVKINVRGAYTLIRGYVSVYADLPLATQHDGELWIVLRGSQPKVPLTKWYEHPAGLYISAEDEWQIAPISTEFSEITSLQANITDWSTFYASLDYVNLGTSILYNNKVYSNLTGNFTATPPSSDTTNWGSKLSFDITNTTVLSVGEIGWNVDDGTLQIGMKGGQVIQQVGEENLIYVKNSSGVDLSDGIPVYINSASVAVINVTMADASSPDNNRKTLAVTTEPIAKNAFGYVTTFGLVRDIDTHGFTDGDELYVAVGGGITNVKPALPNGIVRVGVCVNATVQGSIFVDISSRSVKDIMVDTGDLTIKTALGYTVILENPVYEDLNFDPANSGGPAVSLPDYVTINNVYYREFTSANNQTCGAANEIPHNAKLGGQTFYPHLHIFLKTGESAGTTGVTFRLYWSLRQEGIAAISGSADLTATSAQLTANPNKFNLNYATGFTGSTLLGAQLAMRLDRIAGNAGDVVVTTYGIHYPIDTMGSRQVTVK